MSLGAVFDPCREALIPSYVPRNRLVVANTINVVTWSCMFLSPFSLSLSRSSLILSLLSVNAQASLLFDVFRF